MTTAEADIFAAQARTLVAEIIKAAVAAASMDTEANAEFSTPVHLADGTVGYPVRAPRGDDCQAAAIATVLQVPIDEVFDPHLDERLAAGEVPDDIDRSAQQELKRWLEKRGLRMVLHRSVPVARKRWIGVCPMPGTFNSHCLVMSRGELLFDPVNPRDTGEIDGRRIKTFRAEDVRYGLSFQQTSKE